MLIPFADSQDLKVRCGEVLRFYIARDFVKYEPTHFSLPFPQMTVIKNDVYGPLVKKLLELEEPERH